MKEDVFVELAALAYFVALYGLARFCGTRGHANLASAIRWSLALFGLWFVLLLVLSPLVVINLILLALLPLAVIARKLARPNFELALPAGSAWKPPQLIRAAVLTEMLFILHFVCFVGMFVERRLFR